MTLSKIETTIRWALITLLSLTVVVACGPQNRKHRMPMKAGQKALPPKLTPEQQKKQEADLKDRSQKVQEIEKQIASAKNFSALDRNSLKDGTYTLDKVMTYFSYMSPDVRVYREHGIQNYDLTAGAALTTGFVASLSDSGRYFEIPLKFIVDRSQNQDWLAAGDAAFPQVVNLKSMVKPMKDMTFDLEDRNESVNLDTRAKASVALMLASATLTKDNAYFTKDENGKEVFMKLLNVSENRLNISFDVVESEQPFKKRTVVLSYSIEKKASEAQTAGAQQATTADGQLAPEQAPGADQVPGVDL